MHGWLLWLGIASIACLPPLGVPTLGALAVGGFFVLCWIGTNIALRSLVCSFIYLALEIFFRASHSASFQLRRPSCLA